MTTDRQKEKAQIKYLSKFSDNQIHCCLLYTSNIEI